MSSLIDRRQNASGFEMHYLYTYVLTKRQKEKEKHLHIIYNIYIINLAKHCLMNKAS